jgi:hypothetical protein
MLTVALGAVMIAEVAPLPPKVTQAPEQAKLITRASGSVLSGFAIPLPRREKLVLTFITTYPLTVRTIVAAWLKISTS